MAGTKGRSGRNPIPTAILIREGKYREDHHGKRRGEPQPRGVPRRPGHLSDDAVACWEEIVPQLVGMGVARRADSQTLGTMCEAWVRLHDLELCWEGAGFEDRLALVPRIGQALDAWLKLASRFGLTPSDRTRIQVEEQETQGDEFAAMLA